MAKVLYRPFEDSDFEPLAEVVRGFWHSDSDLPSREYALAEASYDLAYLLGKSTFSQVALVDGVPSGIVLARADDANAAPLAHWAKTAASLDRSKRRSLLPTSASTHGTTSWQASTPASPTSATFPSKTR